MVLMVLLAEVMKIKTLTAGNSLKNNTGFTLIELLVVVVIVGILASFITLSIKLAKPSAIKTLKMKIQQHIVSVEGICLTILTLIGLNISGWNLELGCQNDFSNGVSSSSVLTLN
jgi:prepilin-type N-terminal cleavage/methylation domain-containing protein